MTVTYKEYEEIKMNFINKHSKKTDFTVQTSPMNNNNYYKMYIFDDGSFFEEVNDLVYEPYEVEVKGVVIKGYAKLWRTEFFSTDDSKSRCIYEKA